MTTGGKVAIGCFVAVALAGGLTLAFCGVLFYLRGKDANRTSAETPSTTVTATDLCNEYGANEIAAEGRYKGSVLRVIGTVEEIDAGIGGATVVLECPGTESINCVTEKSDAASLRKGQLASLVCLSSGKILGHIQLRECRLR